MFPSESETDGEGAPEANPDAQEVRRRHVLYIPGYDPRDPALYRRLAAYELRKFSRLWGVNVAVDREDVAEPSVPSLRWGARVSAGEAEVNVTYETLRWEDFVARDFAAPLPLTILRGFRTVWEALGRGFLWRVWRASPWCAVAWFYPMFITLAIIAASLALGLFVGEVIARREFPLVGVVVGATIGFGLPLAALTLLRRSGSFIVHLIDDGRSQRRYARRADKELDARVDAFAARIRAVVTAREADEVLVVGHSSGSFIAIDAIARAYEAEPDFARGANLSLLTVGASELLIAFQPGAGWFRERIRRLAVEPSLFWAEVVGAWDALNFPARDPVTELKLDVPADRPNPTFRLTYISKMLTEQSVRSLQKGYRVFRTHFQFIMANEVRGPYDYFSLVCGPWTARSQFARTADHRLMSPLPGPAPEPLPRAAWLPPLPQAGAAPRRKSSGGAVRP